MAPQGRHLPNDLLKILAVLHTDCAESVLKDGLGRMDRFWWVELDSEEGHSRQRAQRAGRTRVCLEKM